MTTLRAVLDSSMMPTVDSVYFLTLLPIATDDTDDENERWLRLSPHKPLTLPPTTRPFFAVLGVAP